MSEKDLPKNLMKDVFWAFSRGIFENQDEFNKQIRDYHIRIKGEDVWKADETVYSFPEIQFCYEYWSADGESQLEDFIELKADNGEYFMQGELLFKINNAVAENVSRGDHVFFEGLNLSEEMHDGKPFYWMYLGS